MMLPSDVRQRKGRGHQAPASPDVDGDGNVNENVASDTGLLTLCKISLGIFLVIPTLIFLFVALVLPSKIDPIDKSFPEPRELTGALTPNQLLLKAEKLFEGKLIGPESIIIRQGHMYTGTADGKILHIEKGEIDVIALLGKPPCGGYNNEPTCGRPLGMRFDKDGYLIVADAYLGLHRVNVATGDTSLLLPSTREVSGRTLGFMNDFDIGSDGSIYFTDTSRFQRRDFPLDLLEGRGTGRLIKFNEELNTTELLLDGLHFANGVQISQSGDYLLVAESTMFRVLKYHLSGPRQGQSEVFIDRLPCAPDNVRHSSGGGYWLTCGICRFANQSPMADYVEKSPWLRGFLAKLPLPISLLYPDCGIIMEVDKQGEIVRSLMDVEGSHVSLLSEVEDDAGTLYIGSFKRPYIVKIDTFRLKKEA